MNLGCGEVLLVIQLLPKRPSPIFFSPMQLMGSTTRADDNLWFQRHGRDRDGKHFLRLKASDLSHHFTQGTGDQGVGR